ncbi:peptidoglycan-associated lipoprotein Pal [Bdellovibrionota bacterium FG-1]
MTLSSATLRRLAFSLMLGTLVYAAGCSSNKPKTDEGAVPNAPAADENLSGDSDSGKAMGLQTVHFGYDSSTLDAEAKTVLETNASLLKGKASVKVQVEGHCDHRGGIQYNIALGEKRANAAKSYLVDLGVSADRISTISFGKERPLDTGTSEAAYAKNRRGNFVVTAK